jgi:hypothetical protein
MVKNKNVHAIISITSLQMHFFFEIHDQGVLNGLDIVLILLSKTKLGEVW